MKAQRKNRENPCNLCLNFYLNDFVFIFLKVTFIFLK